MKSFDSNQSLHRNPNTPTARKTSTKNDAKKIKDQLNEENMSSSVPSLYNPKEMKFNSIDNIFDNYKSTTDNDLDNDVSKDYVGK